MSYKVVKCYTASEMARLGGKFCAEEKPTGFNLVKRDVRYDLSNMSKTKQDELIQQDKFIGKIDYWDVEENYEDEGYATSGVTGQRKQTTKGAVRWKFKFDKGACFHKELSKLNKSEDYAIEFVYEDDSKLLHYTKDGKLKGFDCTLFTNNRHLNLSADSLGSSLMVDLTEDALYYWNNDNAIVESSDYSFKELKPIAGLNIEYVSAPVNAATTTKVKISNICSDAVVSGLTTTANWKLERDGVKEAVSGVSEVNGEYTFTHTALATGEKVRFVIDSSGYDIYVLDTNYYAGASKEIEVV